MPTNFELKRLKPKLDIVEKPENRVHKLTDSNVSLLELSSFPIPRAKHFVKNHACPFFYLKSQMNPQNKRIFILVQLKLISDTFNTT